MHFPIKWFIHTMIYICNSISIFFFLTKVYQTKSPRAIQGRRSLNEVGDMNVRVGSENYADMENS